MKIKSQRIGDMVMVIELESAVHRDQKQPCLVKIKSNGDIGCFFNCPPPPPKKLKYVKPRLGESMLT